jgi:uncharacterized membrane protein
VSRVSDVTRHRPRRTGASLVVAGLLGVAFFWLTDPRYGWAKPVAVAGDNPIDAAHYMLAGTVVGVVGSVVVLLIGLWLMTRRAG